MHKGFLFDVFELFDEKRIVFDLPHGLYDLLLFIGAPARYVIHDVVSKKTGEAVASSSTQRLSLIAGHYVGKDDPVMIVRAQSGLPAVGEVLEPFAHAFAHAFVVAGGMRGSHHRTCAPVLLRTRLPLHSTRWRPPA